MHLTSILTNLLNTKAVTRKRLPCDGFDGTLRKALRQLFPEILEDVDKPNLVKKEGNSIKLARLFSANITERCPVASLESVDEDDVKEFIDAEFSFLRNLPTKQELLNEDQEIQIECSEVPFEELECFDAELDDCDEEEIDGSYEFNADEISETPDGDFSDTETWAAYNNSIRGPGSRQVKATTKS